MEMNGELTGVIKLRTPIKSYDGSEISELEYNAENITLDEYLEYIKGAESGYEMSMCLGKAAIHAANPKLEQSDINRIKGVDILKVAKIGTNFIKASGESMLED